MTIEWTTEAYDQVKLVLNYIKDEFGQSYIQRFEKKIGKVLSQLVSFPESAPQEQLLADNNIFYRSVKVGKHNKLIYFIDYERGVIVIADIWDTRMDPEKLMRRVR